MIKLNIKIQITLETLLLSASTFTTGVFLVLVGGGTHSVLMDLLEIVLELL